MNSSLPLPGEVASRRAPSGWWRSGGRGLRGLRGLAGALVVAFGCLILGGIAVVARARAPAAAAGRGDGAAPAAQVLAGARDLVGCLQSRFPRLAPALATTARFTSATAQVAGAAVAGWRAEGVDGARVRLRLFFPANYQDGCLVAAGGIEVRIRPLQAAAAVADAASGRIAYPGAYPSTAVLCTAASGRSEEFLYLADRAAPTRFDYAIDDRHGAMRIMAWHGGLRFSDAAGDVLAMEAPYVVDAHGTRSTAAAHWELAAEAVMGSRRLTLVLDPGALAYPMVIDPTWTTEGNLATSPSGHAATLLPSGAVLIAGGDAIAAPGDCELYHPETGSWSQTGALSEQFQQGAALLLPSGKVLQIGGFDVSSESASCELYDPTTGSWSPTGSLLQARYNITATLLPSGHVLVTGGSYGISGYLSSCELYDPATGSWSATGAMAVPRGGHTATLLPAGTVLVAGGWDGSGSTASCELYDPASGRWHAAGPLATNRWFHSATLLPSGTVLVAGGSSDGGLTTLVSSELYDPAANSWLPTTGPLAGARFQHTATLLPSGLVLVAGGFPTGGTVPVATTELFDPGTGRWSPGAPLAHERAMATATLLGSGRVLMVGGTDWNLGSVARVEVYDPTVVSWSATAGDMAGARDWHTATLLPSGKVLVAGGFDDQANAVTAGCELFDPATGTWQLTGALNVARCEHTATLLSDGTVLVAGGVDDSDTALAQCEIYDPAGGTWTATTAMTLARTLQTATLLPSGRILITGGIGNNIPVTGSNVYGSEVYDPLSRTWTASAGAMVVPRFDHTATLLPSGLVLAVGGVGESSVLVSCELYDPATDSWTATAGTTALARSLHTATLLPSGGVLIAGGTDGYPNPDSCELYDPSSGTWSPTGAMMVGRFGARATMLPAGTVLMAGGSYSSPASEIYDPTTGVWTQAGDMDELRISATATLLLSGTVLLAGGSGAANLQSSEIADPLGFTPWMQPVIASATSPLHAGAGAPGACVVSGTGFHPPAEASSGGSPSSPTNYPLVQIISQVNEQQAWLPVDPLHPWSGTSFTSTQLSGFPLGQIQLRVVVDGIASSAVLASIHPPESLNWPPPGGITYGTALSATQLDAVGTVPGTFSYQPPAGTLLGAGAHLLTAIFTPYDLTTYAVMTTTVSLPVSAAPLTITANDILRTYGAADGFSCSAAILVGSDAVGSATYHTTAVAGSPPGSYPITVSSAVFSAGTAANYAITYVPGTLTITPALLFVTATNLVRPFGVANPPLTVSYFGFADGDSAAALTAPVLVTTSATPASPVGQYPITAHGAASADYEIFYEPGTLTVVADSGSTTGAGDGSTRCGHGSGFSAAAGLLLLGCVRLLVRRRPLRGPVAGASPARRLDRPLT